MVRQTLTQVVTGTAGHLREVADIRQELPEVLLHLDQAVLEDEADTEPHLDDLPVDEAHLVQRPARGRPLQPPVRELLQPLVPRLPRLQLTPLVHVKHLFNRPALPLLQNMVRCRKPRRHALAMQDLGERVPVLRALWKVLPKVDHPRVAVDGQSMANLRALHCVRALPCRHGLQLGLPHSLAEQRKAEAQPSIKAILHRKPDLLLPLRALRAILHTFHLYIPPLRSPLIRLVLFAEETLLLKRAGPFREQPVAVQWHVLLDHQHAPHPRRQASLQVLQFVAHLQLEGLQCELLEAVPVRVRRDQRVQVAVPGVHRQVWQALSPLAVAESVLLSLVPAHCNAVAF
mmetsp:Transcript_57170/g.134152  ORF Transcript_57170/g.134152 Transcript_57170/m.134152 type:complete len:345 (-) Transcript_57170:981-2015(-)